MGQGTVLRAHLVQGLGEEGGRLHQVTERAALVDLNYHEFRLIFGAPDNGSRISSDSFLPELNRESLAKCLGERRATGMQAGDWAEEAAPGVGTEAGGLLLVGVGSGGLRGSAWWEDSPCSPAS